MTTLARLSTLAVGQRGRLAAALALGVLASASSVALIGSAAWLIARASQHPPLAALSLAIVGVRIFALCRFTARYAERLVTHDATLRVLSTTRVAVYQRLETLAPTGLRDFGDGALLASLVADVDGIADVFARGLLPFASAVLVGAAVAAVCVAILPAAGAVVLAGLAMSAVLVPWVAVRAAGSAEEAVVAARADLADQVVDAVAGADELVAYGAAADTLAALARADRRLTRDLGRSATRVGAGSAASALVGGLTVWAALALAVPAATSGRLPVVLLAVVVLAPLALGDVLAVLPAAAAALRRSTAGARRVFALLDSPAPTREPTRPATLRPGPHGLRVRGLRVRWEPEAPDALRGLDLELPAGRRVAVVGPSGSGKTTLAMVLTRFLDPSGGSVQLAGVPLGDYAADDVRSVVGLLGQDAHVFDSTVRDNVQLARPGASDQHVRAALAGARLLDWVDGLPDGLDTPVGVHGQRLSGGQRQRLALARALLADFPVLILDEPGEHLDVPTADALTADLLAQTQDRTVLLITHRLAGLDDVDEIIVLADGRVAERGTHAELVAAGGRYRDQWLRENGLPA